jgi:hypothetical protein
MISRWLKQYQQASSQTKYFIINWMVYGLAILITTFYCYARLDFVRSYRTPSVMQSAQQSDKNR